MEDLGAILIGVGGLLLALGLSVLATRRGDQGAVEASKPAAEPLVQVAKTEAAKPAAPADVPLRIDPDEAYRLREAALRRRFTGYDRSLAEADIRPSGVEPIKPRRRSYAPRAPPGRTPIGRKFMLEYSDEDGEVTERTIRVIGVRAWQNVVYVTADCSLRRAQRTFRPDRMLQLIDSRTKDKIYDPEGFFAPWCDNG